jgi:hypothetical protein
VIAIYLIASLALRIMPSVPRRAGARLDIAGAIVLFAGLLCLIGPLLFGHDVHWTPWLWLVMAAGVAIMAAFLRLEQTVASREGMPLIELALLSDGMYGTTAQIANAAGVAAIGAAFFAVEAVGSAQLALLASSALFALSIIACAIFLLWMRRTVR